MTLLARLDEAADAVRTHSLATPTIGVVLGSGLGAWADGLDELVTVPYAAIPHMPQVAIAGHPGNLCMGTVAGVRVACLQGRVHLYEGHPLADVVFGVRMLARLGCRAVLLTNAAGGLRREFKPGELMLVTDHLNLTGQNPLCGPNDPELGTRFPDMTTAYDKRFRALARDAAAEVGLELREGIYASCLGPSYETPAEIAMLRTLGADAVGMSTVPEVIALRHMRVRTAAISCITNLAAGMSPTELSHAEVEATARRTRDKFVALLSAWVKRVGPALDAPPSSRGSIAP